MAAIPGRFSGGGLYFILERRGFSSEIFISYVLVSVIFLTDGNLQLFVVDKAQKKRLNREPGLEAKEIKIAEKVSTPRVR